MKNKILTAIWLVCSAASVIYGINVMMLGSGTMFYAIWYAIGLVFLVFAVFAWKDLWKKLPKVLKVLFIAVVVIGLGCFTVTEGLIASGFNEEGKADLDYILVLGAQIYESGPSVVLKYRLDKAIDYMNENPGTICIVSGGQGYNEPMPEGEAMKNYLVENGIPAERIIAETEAESTEENLINSVVFMEDGSTIGLVTNDFHVYRALKIAEKLGVDNVCGIAADSRKVYLPNNMLREFLALIKMKL